MAYRSDVKSYHLSFPDGDAHRGDGFKRRETKSMGEKIEKSIATMNGGCRVPELEVVATWCLRG